ncbi:hypothetical protein K474DRAFT_1706914 [Panus rudis PR-1116 ss-1]|nr:hypothetical protein K474DRAFT_1706914 [Panus rudis PR-1116 ss-1]
MEHKLPGGIVQSAESSSDDYDTEDELRQVRGRTDAQRAIGDVPQFATRGSRLTNKGNKGHNRTSSNSGDSRRNSPSRMRERVPFTRSRSPAVAVTADGNGHFLPPLPHRTSSPSIFSRSRHSNSLRPVAYILPGSISLTFGLPFSITRWTVSMDVRQAIENLLLLCSLGFMAVKIRTCAEGPNSPDMWISIASVIYCVWTRVSISRVSVPAPTPPQPLNRPGSPRTLDVREPKRGASALISSSSLKIDETAFVWMTVPKNYRDSADDGVLTGLLVGPLIACALLYLSILSIKASTSTPAPQITLPPNWLIEPPAVLQGRHTALEALLFSRRNLVSQATFCSTILIVHTWASWVTEARHRRKTRVPDGELSHVPRKESRRTYLYFLFSISVTLWILCVRILLAELKIGIWQNLSYFEVVVSSTIFQFSLYTAVRLAHRGFTLGELALTCFGATVLFMEMTNITIARIWPVTTPFIKTYRLPTPLLLYQIALIPGSLLVGFLLSPLLYLSRHISQQPVRRLRFPEARTKHRRLLALAFYLGTVLIVGGLVGLWTRWCLGGRDPWVWAAFWLLEGKRKWSRPLLLGYWALLVSLSVAGWNRQLARSRRYRHRGVMSAAGDAPATFDSSRLSGGGSTGQGQASDPSRPPTPPVTDAFSPLGLTFPNLPNLSNSTGVSGVATDWLDAADKHVPTLSVNARRKFFHALAVALFLPGIAVDPAFTHLSFSVAFAVFTFAEYVRYFALYPFGASVHVFMSEFLDTKDSGTAILSHFYLLTGCAGSVWFEGPLRFLQYTGTIALGVGDAMASTVGKRLGRHRWTPTTPKTVEGSAAFTLSTVFCAWLLRVCGLTEDFSVVRYAIVAGLASLLEAFSVQNDNLTLPIYMWTQADAFSPSLAQFMDSSQSNNAAGSENSPFPLPSLAINDISLSVASNLPHIAVPRLSVGHRAPRSKLRRPSTASSAEERSILLPAGGDPISPGSTVSSEDSRMPYLDSRRESPFITQKPSIEEVNRRAHEAVAGLRAEASRLAGAVEVLPSPFDPSPSGEMSMQNMPVVDQGGETADYDWASFIHAYAWGRWDPLRTPQPPRSHLESSHQSARNMLHSIVTEVSEHQEPFFDSPEMGSEQNWMPEPTGESSSCVPSDHEEVSRDSPEETRKLSTVQSQAPAKLAPSLFSLTSLPPNQHPVSPSAPLSNLADRRIHIPPMNLGPFSHRLRNSFADLRSSSSGTGSIPESRPANLSNADITTSAAAIRWAAAGVSVAPLALPSPEHELTDPMRGITATIPGSHPPDVFVRPEPLPLQSPGTLRKSRLSSFWQGTQDVDDDITPPSQPSSAGKALPPPQSEDGDPGNKEKDRPSSRGSSLQGSSTLPFVGPPVFPATAPVRAETEQEDEDYFGWSDGLKHDYASSVNSDMPGTSIASTNATTRTDLDIMRQSSAPPFNEPSTVPALPRRICLTRQTSAPAPSLALYERRMRASRPASDGNLNILAGRAAKEEQMFNELGYLAPPNPPDELERRRALYKQHLLNAFMSPLLFYALCFPFLRDFVRFNIWNTGADANFDRIAHLVKLVFCTRIVTISLVDGTDVFLKSQSGFDAQSLTRTSSFEAHTILQRDDEPMVILDAQDDWRFAKNPLVVGDPRVRFYAGCPLRTQDGYNIGTLSIMDDGPWREFSPRQRHTLKEFAQVAMRELELWRDKIQLRIRDRIQNSMEQFTRECLEVDKDNNGDKSEGHLFVGTSMEQIYERAAKLVRRTLDVEGALVMDVSHVDVLETVGAESSVSISIHQADPQARTTTRSLCAEEHAKLQEFFRKNPDGKISEGIVPVGLRPFLPSRIQYALSVPIFNIDKRPFAVLCAYSTGERTTPFLEGHELSYLRAIGVIILSAVLKRRMILADKAKSLFISNISHELRTPLHGILASAELLSDTQLDHSQASFLQTVQACGTSLVETVNHVLDFTKLSGNAKSGGIENTIHRSKLRISRVDLMQLVEEATEGCWIGHRARMFTSEIGSVYSPPKPDRPGAQAATVVPSPPRQVETVIDIGPNTRGWIYKCEKGGIRRVLMNLFGNSLKFTSDGYVHVMLRQLPPSPDLPPGIVKLELSVIDTGKGISQSFLKNQLFHPFSQENPLQTGTGLGLAIVNSIVRSSSVDGKVDVWSAEGVGTEIKVTFTAETVEEETANNDVELMRLYESLRRPSISLVGFDESHRGPRLLKEVLTSYLTSRWGFTLSQGPELGDIVIVNEDCGPVSRAIKEKDVRRPYIILSSARGDPRIMNVVGEYEHIGGFCRIAYKPIGPYRLYSVLRLCLHALNISEASRYKSSPESDVEPPPGAQLNGHARVVSPARIATESSDRSVSSSPLPRRFSEESGPKKPRPVRPLLGPRATTANPSTSWTQMIPSPEEEEPPDREYTSDSGVSHSPTSSTVTVGSGGTLLKSSISNRPIQTNVRVLVVEDNAILRNLLIKWLKNKGYDYRDAVDGVDGVRVFETGGHFDVVLLDLSMPELDGVGATAQMRNIESERQKQAASDHDRGDGRVSRILALTGMSSLEDKRRAFEAGVDGYLVKPVAFKTLDNMFHKLGFS